MPERMVKIVATIGPASEEPAMLDALLDAGMDVARLNCSHATHEGLRSLVAALRAASERKQRPLGLLLDLSGPKIRTGRLQGGAPVELIPGASLVIRPGLAEGNAQRIGCTYDRLAREVSVGERILLDDGLLELEVQRVDGDDVHCRVVVGGLLNERKGLNLPDTVLSIPCLTDKDRADLQVGLELEVDFVALSFVQTAKDVQELKDLILSHGRAVPVVAKLERPQAIENLDEILTVADVVMVARGDLGVEAGFHRVPMIQKHILREASQRAVPDITATQMLDSMIRNPRPTRAEAADVANAILDGTDAVMLSGETATGRYPVEAVAMMDRIAREVEAQSPEIAAHTVGPSSACRGAPLDVAEAACAIARKECYRAIVVLTGSGSMARLIAAYGPRVPIFALTPSVQTLRQLTLVRGVHPVLLPLEGGTDEILHRGETLLLERGHVHCGDEVILVSGQLDTWGVTQLLKVFRVRDPATAFTDSRVATTRIMPQIDL